MTSRVTILSALNIAWQAIVSALKNAWQTIKTAFVRALPRIS